MHSDYEFDMNCTVPTPLKKMSHLLAMAVPKDSLFCLQLYSPATLRSASISTKRMALAEFVATGVCKYNR
jgi:hypothetical protein